MIDGRLLVPAGGAWLASAAVLAGSGQAWLPTPPDRQQFAVLVLACSAVVFVGSGLVILAAHGTLHQRTPAWLLVVLLGCSAGALSAALHVQALTAAPLAAWAEQSALVAVTGVSAEEPVAAERDAGWGVITSARMRLATASVEHVATGARIQVDVPLQVEFPADSIPADLPAGTHVEVTGRLVEPFLRHEFAGTLRNAELVRVIGAPGLVDAAASSMRAGLRASVAQLEPDPAALVAGLAVGDDSQQPASLDEAMVGSGLAHLTAVSGGNVAIVLAAVLGVAALVRMPLPARVAVAMVALGYFVMLVRPQPSVLRASVMGAVVLAALVIGGRRPGPAVLSGSVLALMVLAAPLALSWGFALSVTATAGLILVAPMLTDLLRRVPVVDVLPEGVRSALAITVAAQVGALPVLAAMGAGGGPIAIPANLLAMPAVPAVTILGLLAALLSGPLPAVAALMAELAGYPAGWIATVAHRSVALSPGPWPLPEGGWGSVVVVLLLAAVVIVATRSDARDRLRRMPRAGRRAVAASACVVAALWIIAPADRRSWPPPDWFLMMCDVGQGDALILRDGSGVVVVDAGPDPTAVDACLRDADIAAVSVLIVSHFHRDHVGGVSGALRGRSVGRILGSPLREPEGEFARVRDAAAAAGLAVEEFTAGGVLRAGDITVSALWPRRIIRSGSAPNNASLVLDIDVAGLRVLLTGDIEPEAQAAVMGARGGFDIAKVPHHGSRNQHPRFAPWAEPTVALITVGAGNEYGHPAPETLAAWQEQGSLILRTDIDGAVAMVRTDQGWGTVTRSS